MDYSVFDSLQWQCTSQSRLDELESSSGYRYTAVLDLPYLVPWRMLVDPKHFLGDIWLDMGIVTPNQFSTIQKCVDRFMVPSDIDRNSYKIESGFLSFTADQLKNWIVFYSFAAMTGIVTDAHLQCWKLCSCLLDTSWVWDHSCRCIIGWCSIATIL